MNKVFKANILIIIITFKRRKDYSKLYLKIENNIENIIKNLFKNILFCEQRLEKLKIDF